MVSTTAPEMIKEGKDIAAWHKNIVVKVPLIPEGLKAVKVFTAEGIRTNVTLCFNANQALLAAKAGATYVSPFVGRLDDISTDGMQLIRDIRLIYDNYGYETQILTASARSRCTSWRRPGSAATSSRRRSPSSPRSSSTR